MVVKVFHTTPKCYTDKPNNITIPKAPTVAKKET